MPPPTYGRTRTQSTPDLSGSNVILGKLYQGIPVGGVYTGKYSDIHVNEYVYNYHSHRTWNTAKVTMDTIHKRIKGKYLSGDAFSCLKYVWSVPYEGVFGQGTYERSDKTFKYVGGFHPPQDYSPMGTMDRFDFLNKTLPVLLATVNNTNHPSMAGLGDKAWKSTKPKLQKADAGVFTSELRDMPRMLRQTAKRYDQIWRAMGGIAVSKKVALKRGFDLMQPKKVADDFLSQQFGWIPFVKDLIKFDSVVQNYHDIIAKAIERNDRWVRRRVPILNEEVVSTIRTQAAFNMLPVVLDSHFYLSGTVPIYTVEEVKQTNISAVGKFRYYRPEFDVSVQDKLSQWNSAQQFLTVSGFRVTPSNVYNAIPWTWAIDWFANVGDWVDNLTDTWVDSIVSEYCFVMKREKTVRRATQFAPFFSGTKSFMFEREIDSKQRLKASSPYDFSLTWDNLTPRQIAIAAALGIGRFPKIAQ